jgi:hypothetical protein
LRQADPAYPGEDGRGTAVHDSHDNEGVTMANDLSDLTIAILAADGVEQVELERPRQAVREAGARVQLLSIQDGEIQAMNNDLEPADTFTVDRRVSDASIDDYDGLILPAARATPIDCAWTPTPSPSCATSYAPESRWA